MLVFVPKKECYLKKTSLNLSRISLFSSLKVVFFKKKVAEQRTNVFKSLAAHRLRTTALRDIRI